MDNDWTTHEGTARIENDIAYISLSSLPKLELIVNSNDIVTGKNIIAIRTNALLKEIRGMNEK